MKAFDLENGEWGVRELASHLNFPRSSTQELLSTLADEGLLIKNQHGRYKLGVQVLNLSNNYINHLDIRTESLPVMNYVATKNNFVTINLGVLDRNEIVYIAKVDGTNSPSLITSTGFRCPAHCLGLGKTLLAYQQEEIILNMELTKMTNNTITNHKDLLRELESIRTHDIAFDRGEGQKDIYCISAPIRDFTSNIVASISISTREIHYNKYENYIRSNVKEMSKIISQNMGYSKDNL